MPQSQITLGTIVLLTGVLALSWRLSNDPTTRSSIGQAPLTPDMGFVSDDNDSEAETEFLCSDQESRLNSGHSPLVTPTTCEPSSRISHDLRTPTAKNNDLLSITRARRTGLTEADEIWGELEDDRPTPPSSSFPQRKSSARSTPSKLRSCSEDRDSDTFSPNESTALLERSNTGRSYRDRRRRRPMPLGESGTRERRRSGIQDALGGWWKMGWWRTINGDDRRKGANVNRRIEDG